jgi:hypothetical protein
MCINTMSMHSIYLVSDLEGSDAAFQRRSLLRDYLLTLVVNSRFSHGLVQMGQYGPI